MRISSVMARGDGSGSAAEEAVRKLRSASGEHPGHIFVSYDSRLDPAEISDCLSRSFPDTSFIAASSYSGVLSDQSGSFDTDRSVAMLALYDGEGSFGSACGYFGDVSSDAEIEAIIEQAITRAGRNGEAPDAVWISASAGDENRVIGVIESMMGQSVQICGGTPGTLNGLGADPESRSASAPGGMVCGTRFLAVTVFFPSCRITTCCRSAFAPSNFVGRITRNSGNVVYEINYRPAAEQYADWLRSLGYVGRQERLSPAALQRQSVLHPIGFMSGSFGAQAFYKAAICDRVGTDGSMTLLADIPSFEAVTVMSDASKDAVAGCFSCDRSSMLYYRDVRYYGSMYAVCASYGRNITGAEADRLAESVRSIQSRGAYAGLFSDGEQGRVGDSRNQNGYLMVCGMHFYDAI